MKVLSKNNVIFNVGQTVDSSKPLTYSLFLSILDSDDVYWVSLNMQFLLRQ